MLSVLKCLGLYVVLIGIAMIMWAVFGPKAPHLSKIHLCLGGLLFAPAAFIISLVYLAVLALRGHDDTNRVLAVARVVSLSLLLLVATAILAFVGYGLPEGIYPLEPLVDTQMAPSYSPAMFDEIKVGMTEDEVLQKLGEPLTRTRSRWGYTMDGACSWGDFAWLYQYIEFEGGHVVRILAGWAYD